jgi:hypothetical protein
VPSSATLPSGDPLFASHGRRSYPSRESSVKCARNAGNSLTSPADSFIAWRVAFLCADVGWRMGMMGAQDAARRPSSGGEAFRESVTSCTSPPVRTCGSRHCVDGRGFRVPRPRCSIAAVAETRVGVGGWSVGGGGGSRVSVPIEQGGCHGRPAPHRAGDDTARDRRRNLVEPYRRCVFRVRPARLARRKPHRLLDSIRAVATVVQRGDDVAILCAAARCPTHTVTQAPQMRDAR